jgi:hypothetical protein
LPSYFAHLTEIRKSLSCPQIFSGRIK